MSEQKERPILFNGEMVRAILEGRKTVTRRLVMGGQIPALDPSANVEGMRWSAIGQRHPRYGYCVFGETEEACALELGERGVCPYGKPGDLLWVREAWQLHEKFTDNCVVVYKANERNSWTEFHRRFPVEVARGTPAKPFQAHGFRPSIHMPRWACRILLEVTDVRVERLQDITEDQARAEGITDGGCTSCGNSEPCGCDCPSPSAVDSFYHLWKSTGGDWDANPWVWVVEFKRVDHLA